jgi:hypothetical protein
MQVEKTTQFGNSFYASFPACPRYKSTLQARYNASTIVQNALFRSSENYLIIYEQKLDSTLRKINKIK